MSEAFKDRPGDILRSLQNIRVLVLDDEEPVRSLLNVLLTRNGCVVETAGDGREGLQILLQKDFDVVIVDLRMPDMGGSAFLEQARSVWPWMGVIVLTGYADEESRAHAARFGVTRILVKPMNQKELLRAVLEEAMEKKELVEMSASHSLDRIQSQLSLLRSFSESALAQENIDNALHTLSAGLGDLLPCAVVGILNLQGEEPVLHLHALVPVAQDFLLNVEQETLRRYEALSGNPAPGRELRVIFDATNLDPQGAKGVGSSFTVPIVARDTVGGMLTMAAIASDAYSSRDAAFLYHAANRISTVLTALSRMRELSVRDALTGLYNRRGLEEEYQRLWSISRRYKWPIGVAVLDIDRFKHLNDTHGHLVGDHILREFADLVQQVARESDIIGRYGGDETVVVLAQAGNADCIAFAERLLHAMRQHVFCTNKGMALKLTVSIGVASTMNAPSEMPSDLLIAQADRALYTAKNEGRDRVCVYQPARAATPDTPTPSPPADDQRIRGRILIVDDEPMIGKLLSRILQNHDCDVRFETTVADAISAITGQPGYFDIILTDLNLPGKSGLDLLDELRSIDEGLIKIIITGHATLDNAITSLRRGAYDFIEKPVVPDSLVAVIDRALEFRRLKRENARYQAHLEDMVHEKSAALLDALDHIKTSYDFTLEAMASLLDERDSGTADHSLRIRALTGILAREMGLSPSEIEEIERAALLHDIGKIAVPDRILLKPGQLTPEERLEMERHPEVAFKMLSASPHLEAVASIVRAHHEWYDGTGYPRGLKGIDIPLGARIISLIDAYDAMRSNRVHRQGVSSEAAMKEIETNAGTQFDPQLVELFKRCQITIELAANWEEVNAKSKRNTGTAPRNARIAGSSAP